VYVRPPAGGVDHPVQELKGFRRVDLKPGETRHVSVPLDRRSFAYWDVATHAWKVDPGRYEIAVGQSSRDIGGTASVDVK
jgi:beta-glucosidase